MSDLKQNKTARWLTFNKVLILTLLLLLFFGYMDNLNLEGIHELDANYQEAVGWTEENNVWKIYWTQLQPVFYALWIGILAAIGIIWYIITGDKSESITLFAVPAILVTFGVQDLAYFAFSPHNMSTISCWADALGPVRIISDLIREDCPSRLSFTISAAIGTILAWITFYKLKYAGETQ